ncbi:MAG: EF-hand domain-containing protein [Myxococcales bacterium]|nr:EF-hand domain-containing protein [Myxococcales bacterium]
MQLQETSRTTGHPPSLVSKFAAPLFAALAALAVMAPLSSAVASPGGGRAADPVERLLRRFDANGDGMLDRQELREVARARQARRDPARRQERFAKLLARFDVNRDGRLGPGETPPKVAQRLGRFDRNGDGWVDAAELAAGQPPRQAGRAPGAF